MASSRGTRVLVVDDNEDQAEKLAAVVRRWGHACRVAHRAVEARRLVATFRPRVVLLDVALPDQRGCDLARTIRDAAGERQVYFVAITGRGQVADQVRSGAAGISHHLVKPVDFDALREILKAYAEAAPVLASARKEPAYSDYLEQLSEHSGADGFAGL